MFITVDNLSVFSSPPKHQADITTRKEALGLALFGDFRCTKREKKMASKRRRKQKNVKQWRDWSGLPYDILELISRNLHYIDQLNSRAVCKSWRSVINGVPSVKQKMPWLLMFDIDKDDGADKEVDDEYSCKVVDPNYRRTYNMSLNIIKEKNLVNIHVHESKNGWLLISSQPTPEPTNASYSRDYPSGTSFFLFTPFLTHNNFIELPIHTSLFSIATFSSDPSSEDFIVLTMYSHSDTISIDTYCLGGDSSWKIHYFECHFPLAYVKSLVYTNGEFFCSSPLGIIGVFVVAHKDWIVLPAPESPVGADPSIVYEFDPNGIMEVYLVKADTTEDENEDEIFLVYLKNVPRVYGRLTVCVFRLDLLHMIWERQKSIGSRIMFLGSGCTSFVRVERSNKSNNRIYYIWGNKMKHCRVTKANRSYPCSKFFGSLSRNLSRKVWIEPPQHC